MASTAYSAAVSAILFLIGCGLLLLTLILMGVDNRRPWAFFEADGIVFTARARTQVIHIGSAIWAAVIAAAVFTSSDQMDGIHLSEIFWTALAVANTWIAIGNCTTRSRLLIKSDGIEFRGLLSNTVVAWEQLSDPFALADAGLRGPTIPQRGMSLRGLRLRADRLTVPPEWVLETIAYYRDHPDQRALIGTWNELVRISPTSI